MRNIKKVLLLIGPKSQFGVLYAFTKELESAFHASFIEATTFSLQQLGVGELITCVMHTKPDCIIGFNIAATSELGLDVLDVPILSIFVDSVSYFPQIMQCKNMIACFVEEDSCDFLKSMGFSNTYFLPHAIPKRSIGTHLGSVRDLDIVVSCTFYDPEFYVQAWKRCFSPSFCDFLLSLAEQVLASSSASALRLFCQTLAENHAEIHREIHLSGLSPCEIVNSLEQYIRAKDRIDMLRHIIGPTIHLFGPKNEHALWKNAFTSKQKVVFHDEVPYTDLPKLFSRARIVVNSIPMIKRGIHERFLLALAHGASVLSSKNSFIDNTFTESHAVMSVLWPGYRDLNTKVSDALHNEQKRLEDVQACHAVLHSRFTWDVRVGAMCTIL